MWFIFDRFCCCCCFMAIMAIMASVNAVNSALNEGKYSDACSTSPALSHLTHLSLSLLSNLHTTIEHSRNAVHTSLRSQRHTYESYTHTNSFDIFNGLGDSLPYNFNHQQPDDAPFHPDKPCFSAPAFTRLAQQHGITQDRLLQCDPMRTQEFSLLLRAKATCFYDYEDVYTEAAELKYIYMIEEFIAVLEARGKLMKEMGKRR